MIFSSELPWFEPLSSFAVSSAGGCGVVGIIGITKDSPKPPRALIKPLAVQQLHSQVQFRIYYVICVLLSCFLIYLVD